jgi:hypothetical protein
MLLYCQRCTFRVNYYKHDFLAKEKKCIVAFTDILKLLHKNGIISLTPTPKPARLCAFQPCQYSILHTLEVFQSGRWEIVPEYNFNCFPLVIHKVSIHNLRVILYQFVNYLVLSFTYFCCIFNTFFSILSALFIIKCPLSMMYIEIFSYLVITVWLSSTSCQKKTN